MNVPPTYDPTVLIIMLASAADHLISLPPEGWTTVGVVATAISTAAATMFGALLLHKRSQNAAAMRAQETRDQAMEKEIRKLRGYSWLKGEQADQRASYYEAKAEAAEEHSQALLLYIIQGSSGELPVRRSVTRPEIVGMKIEIDAPAEVIENQIRQVVESPEGPKTGPLTVA